MAMAASAMILLFFWTPGLRLLHLWRQTSKPPEGWLAGFFLLLGLGLAVSLYWLGRREEAGYLVSRMVTVPLTTAGMLCIALFTRAVFRPSDGWATAACAASVLVYVIGASTMAALGELGNQMHWINHALTCWALMSLVWAFVECAIYYARMRRQARMGLGDPLVRNRFLLWMIWTGAMVALPAMSIGVKAYLASVTPEGEVVRATGPVLVFVRSVVASMGLAALVAIALSFFPPGWYERWVRGAQSEAAA